MPCKALIRAQVPIFIFYHLYVSQSYDLLQLIPSSQPTANTWHGLFVFLNDLFSIQDKFESLSRFQFLSCNKWVALKDQKKNYWLLTAM